MELQINRVQINRARPVADCSSSEIKELTVWYLLRMADIPRSRNMRAILRYTGQFSDPQYKMFGSKFIHYLSMLPITTARKRSLRRLCFHRCWSVHGGGLCPGGLCPGGFSVQGVSVQGDLCPGGSLSRGVSVSTHPTGMHSCFSHKPPL